MTTQSVWLGPLRGPLKLAMIGSAAVFLLLCLGLILSNLFGTEGYDMHDMVRPQGDPFVIATLLMLLVSILCASAYLSDFRGSIEVERTGPFDVVSLIFSRLAMLGTIALVLVMFYEVVARYVFEAPTLWANELSLWVAAFLFLLAGLYAMQQRSHIRIYIIYDMFPRWMKKTADVISVLLIWVFMVCMIWGMYGNAMARLMRWEKFGTAWDPPIPATVIPGILVIGVLVALQATSNLIADWNKEEEHHSPADDIDEADIEALRRIAEGKN